MHVLLPALEQGAQALGLTLSAQQTQQLLDYCDLLLKWNRVYNLSAVREPQAVLSHHILDCLAVVHPLSRELARIETEQRQQDQAQAQAQPQSTPPRLLDIGAGAGLPGVVLAIALPHLQVCCLDAVEKKTAFVRQVAASLRLSNLSVKHARIEAAPDSQGYDVVSARALAELVQLARWALPWLAPHGVLMAMKGQHPQAELAELAQSAKLADSASPPLDARAYRVEPLQVPQLAAQRCIVWIKRG